MWLFVKPTRTEIHLYFWGIDNLYKKHYIVVPVKADTAGLEIEVIEDVVY